MVVLASVAALGAIVLLGVNLYVQSRATQAKIQQELSHRLGTPLRIRQISVTPWGGLKLSGITIPQASALSTSDFLDAETFRLRIRFFSLFAKRLAVKEVSLVDPTVVWPQNAEGKWRLPGQQQSEIAQTDTARTAGTPEKEGSPRGPVAVPSASIAPLTSEPPAQPTVAKAQKQESAISLVPEIERVNVKRGKFTFLDRRGGMVGNFQGVDFRSSVRGASSVRGNAKVAKISLRDRFFLEHLQSPFSYEPDVLELSKISASAGSGEVTGHFAMQTEADDSPFTANVNFRNVQADQIITDAGGPKAMVQGKLEGSFEAAGKTADVNEITGKGEIFLREGEVHQYSLLVALGQLLQIEELTQLHLEQAEAKYHITSGLVTIDSLVLRSPNIRLSATGTVTFAGKLKLTSQLAINDKIRGQLFKMVRENFQPIDEPGYYALDFQVSGTVDRPKTNLMDRLVGRDLKDLVNSVFGGGERKPKKKKSAETPTEETPASPESTPDDGTSRDAIKRPPPP